MLDEGAMGRTGELPRLVEHGALAPSAPVVFVVDDDVSVRESLELLIAAAGWRPDSFPSAKDFLERAILKAPGCIVLDVSMPGVDGLELQRRIAPEHSDLPIVFLTGYGDVPKTVQAMKAGAVEFLMKPLDPDVLLGAISGAIERSRIAAEQKERVDVLRQRYGLLSRREQEVMALVVAGLLNKRIGDELGISEITVKAHRGSVMRKMRATSLAELVTMSARIGVGAPGDAGPPFVASPRSGVQD